MRQKSHWFAEPSEIGTSAKTDSGEKPQNQLQELEPLAQEATESVASTAPEIGTSANLPPAPVAEVPSEEDEQWTRQRGRWRGIDNIWMPGATSQLVAVHSVKNDRVMFVQLQASKDESGDFYTVNTAFPARSGFLESKKDWKKLWEGRAQPSPPAASEQAPFAVSPLNADKATTIPSGQSDLSVARPTAESKPSNDDPLPWGGETPPHRRRTWAHARHPRFDSARRNSPCSQ